MIEELKDISALGRKRAARIQALKDCEESQKFI